MTKNKDYRINQLGNGQIISIEIKCCGKHIGEIRFMDGEARTCTNCGLVHSLKIHHNHFHLSRIKHPN